MKRSRFWWSIKVIILACIIIGLQSVATVYIHPLVAYPDLLICLFILFLFYGQDEMLHVLFVLGFIIGIIQGVWLHQRIGIAAFYYMLLTYNYEFYKNFVRNNIQLIIIAIIALIFKFIVYLVLAFIYREQVLLNFLFSIESLYHAALSLAVVIVIGCPVNTIIRSKKNMDGSL